MPLGQPPPSGLTQPIGSMIPPPRLQRPIGTPPLPIPLPPSATQQPFMPPPMTHSGAPRPSMAHNALHQPTPHSVLRPPSSQNAMPPTLSTSQHQQELKESIWTAVVEKPQDNKNSPREFAASSVLSPDTSDGAPPAWAHAAYTTQALQASVHSDSEDSESSNRSAEIDDLKMNKFAEKVVLKLGSKFPTTPRFDLFTLYLFRVVTNARIHFSARQNGS